MADKNNDTSAEGTGLRAEVDAAGDLGPAGKYRVFGAFTARGLWMAAAFAGAATIAACLGLDVSNPKHLLLFGLVFFVTGAVVALSFAAGEMQRMEDEVIARRQEVNRMAESKAALEREVLKHSRLSSGGKGAGRN